MIGRDKKIRLDKESQCRLGSIAAACVDVC